MTKIRLNIFIFIFFFCILEHANAAAETITMKCVDISGNIKIVKRVGQSLFVRDIGWQQVNPRDGQTLEYEDGVFLFKEKMRFMNMLHIIDFQFLTYTIKRVPTDDGVKLINRTIETGMPNSFLLPKTWEHTCSKV